MDWSNILGSIAAALAALVFVPLLMRMRKKGAGQNVAEFLNHLQSMGVRAYLVEKGVEQERIVVSRASGQRSEGLVRIEGRNIDYINVLSVAGQQGVRYFLDYLVQSPGWPGTRKRKKTKMVRQRSSPFRGKVIGVQWKGDDYLSRELNFDYSLSDKLLRTELDKLGDISIFPETKHDYARIRTAYLLPSADLFEAIGLIGGHIKAGW